MWPQIIKIKKSQMNNQDTGTMPSIPTDKLKKCTNCKIKEGDIPGLTFTWNEVGHVCCICSNEPSKLALKAVSRIIKDKLNKLGIKTTNCNKCDQEIFFLKTKNDKTMPITMELLSHFADCPYANQFRK